MASKRKNRVAKAYRSSLKGGNYGAAIAASAEKNAVANAYRSSLAGGSYGAAIRAAAKKKKRKTKAKRGGVGKRVGPMSKMNAAERKLYMAALRDARKVGGKKKKPAKKRSTTHKKRGASSVTAEGIIKHAKRAELQKWLCEGKVRTGCGSTGKVVSGAGRFARLRK